MGMVMGTVKGSRTMASERGAGRRMRIDARLHGCLLYTSDAADERSSVDLGGRRILKKKIQTL